MAGWWYTYSSEKYKFVSWDYDIPNWKIKFMFQTTNQMGISWDMGKITINNGDYICILTFYVDAYREYSRIYVYVYVYIYI